jgi:hypothetical protein
VVVVAAVMPGGGEGRLLVAADGSVLALGAQTQSLIPSTPVPGTVAATIDGLTDIANVHISDGQLWRA